MFLTDILTISDMASSRTPGSSFVKSSYAASNASCQNLGNLLRRLLVYTSHMCFTTFSLSSISCFHKNPHHKTPHCPSHLHQDPMTKLRCTNRKKAKETDQNIEIVVDVVVEVVGNMVEVAGGPPESNGAREHRPESEEQNRCQRPELVPTPPKNTRI